MKMKEILRSANKIRRFVKAWKWLARFRAPRKIIGTQEGNSIHGTRDRAGVGHDKSKGELIAVWSCPVWVQSRVPCTSPRCLSFLLPSFSFFPSRREPQPRILRPPLGARLASATGWHPTNKISSKNARDDTGACGISLGGSLAPSTSPIYLRWGERGLDSNAREQDED